MKPEFEAAEALVRDGLLATVKARDIPITFVDRWANVVQYFREDDGGGERGWCVDWADGTDYFTLLGMFEAGAAWARAKLAETMLGPEH